MIDGTWINAGWKLFEANSGTRWSFTDCLSFAIMREFELSAAFTRDQHFEQADFRALLRQN